MAKTKPPPAPKYEAAPDARDRSILAMLMGSIPTPLPTFPADPVERRDWALRNPGVEAVEPGVGPRSRARYRGQPFAELEELDVPIEGQAFEPGLVLATAAVLDGQLHPRTADGESWLGPEGLAGLVRRHARGDLGLDGTLSDLGPAPVVRSRFRLQPPGFDDHQGRFPHPSAVEVMVATAFGVPDAADPDVRRTVTLVALPHEPYLRPVEPYVPPHPTTF